MLNYIDPNVVILQNAKFKIPGTTHLGVYSLLYYTFGRLQFAVKSKWIFEL
jgi:hypothetical protein